MNKKTFHIPIFVPHKGCPHDCAFCNQKKITGSVDVCDSAVVKQTIEQHLDSINSKVKRECAHIEVAFFGGSFTGINIETQIDYLNVVEPFLKRGEIDGIRCSTRPDCINDEILSVLKSKGMSVIELGVQSASDYVLKKTNRGHSFEDVVNASNLIKKHGISLGLQMMTGLPGDTKEMCFETARKIAALKPECVRIYPTLVMEGTLLFDMYRSNAYKPQSLEEAVDLVSYIIPVFNSIGADIIRIGLQTTDNVNQKTVIGPYHPAFAELCYGRIERNKIEKYITENNLSNVTLKIISPKNMFSKITGHKKENCMYFKTKYNINIKLSIGDIFDISILH